MSENHPFQHLLAFQTKPDQFSAACAADAFRSRWGRRAVGFAGPECARRLSIPQDWGGARSCLAGDPAEGHVQAPPTVHSCDPRERETRDACVAGRDRLDVRVHVRTCTWRSMRLSTGLARRRTWVRGVRASHDCGLSASGGAPQSRVDDAASDARRARTGVSGFRSVVSRVVNDPSARAPLARHSACASERRTSPVRSPSGPRSDRTRIGINKGRSNVKRDSSEDRRPQDPYGKKQAGGKKETDGKTD